MNRRAHVDRGFTLVEMLIAIVLSGLIAGVISVALVTSLNVSKSTTAAVNDAADEGLISSYLIRDAQSAGATDATTATVDATVGISTAATTFGWSGCTQTGTLVVRFSWMDRTTVSSQKKVVVTYALDSATQLIRRTCSNGTNVDLVLGSHVLSATATCLPVSACTGLPTSVSLAVTGTGTPAPLAYTLKATLRGDVQAAPTIANSAPVGLVALGAPSTSAVCPNLTLSGTGAIVVAGNVVVDSTCGAAPISGDQTLLKPTGTASSLAGLVDPFVNRVPPVGACSGGTNPAVGVSASSSTIVIYPQAVSVTANQTFQAGKYIFCAGLSITGGTVTGTNLLFYVAGGTVTIGSGATVDLAAATSGNDWNLLMWIATPQTVTIAGGARANSLRGQIYAPTSTVQLSSTLAANIGAVVAKNVVFTGVGAQRLGLPLPVLTITPSTVPSGEVGVAYNTTLAGAGGTAPSTWSATGLPAGLTVGATTGIISGTPTTAAAAAVVVTRFDASGAAKWINYTLTIVARVAVALPATLPAGKVGVAYTSTTVTATGGITPTTWTATGLPNGLVISATGVISGTPTVAGTFSAATVIATDSKLATAQKVYTVSITANAAAVCPATFTGWKGEYFANATLTGFTSLCRDDANVDFDFNATPVPGIAADNFSARWTRTANVVAGSYRFDLGTDDGGRLYIDGVLVIDRWVDQLYPSPVPTVTKSLTSGAHTFVVEYYDRTGPARALLAITQVSNGVTVVPSLSGDRQYYGENILTVTNTAPITAMSLTITVAQTTGLAYNGQYTTFAGDQVTLAHSTSGGFITFTFNIVPGKTIVAGTWTVNAQTNGTGSLHPVTGDSWTATTTSGGVAVTLSGTF